MIFCDDPLLAILGQLAEYFNDGPLRSIVGEIANIALPLIKRNVFSILEKQTGLTLDFKQEQQQEIDPFKSYMSQRATKDKLKENLSKVSSRVAQDTGHPMVFIIDELDRCRPTFAIELLERVKHIFDIPDLVFVFGINRDELCSSLKSVYGDIDVDVYLRSFLTWNSTCPK